MGFVSWFLWHGESIIASILSRIFWPPTRVVVLSVQGEKLLALEVGDYYTLPGGFVQGKESFREAADRELREETGLRAVELERIGERQEGMSGVEMVFKAKVEGDLNGSWEGKPVWINRDAVKDVKWRFDRDVESLLRKHKL
ncbi:MAG: NUDIX hydrolase [Candidatus Nanohaloarchaea archaeon]